MTRLENIAPTSQTLVCTETDARRVAAMLDLDPSTLADGCALPVGWHFFLPGGETKRSSLRFDGFPGLGLDMADLGFPRLLLGGREVPYLDAIPIGSGVRRETRTILRLTKSEPWMRRTPMAQLATREVEAAISAIEADQDFFRCRDPRWARLTDATTVSCETGSDPSDDALDPVARLGLTGNLVDQSARRTSVARQREQIGGHRA
jgi:hypothetical protein